LFADSWPQDKAPFTSNSRNHCLPREQVGVGIESCESLEWSADPVREDDKMKMKENKTTTEGQNKRNDVGLKQRR